MNAVEHSVLIYLLDAIRVAPEKTPDLLKTAMKRKANTAEYEEILEQLQEVQYDPAEAFKLGQKVRESLR